MRFRHSLEGGGEQEAVYTQLWRPIEESLGKHLAEFLRHFAMKDGEEIKQGGIYASTKARFSALEHTAVIKSELSSMRHHAEAYERFVSPDREQRPEIAARLRTIADLNVSTCYPLLLRLFEFNRVGSATNDELERCLRFVESYVVRRAIVGVPPNILSRLFVSWSKNLAATDVVVSLRGMMAGTTGRGRWPMDDELKPAMASGSQYGRKWTREILMRLEEAYDHKEPAELDLCTIEHVMPQRLNHDWMQSLGPQHAELHNRLLHTFGNLTLSAYNPEMGNQPFPEKRARLKSSHVELNRWISEQESWGEKQILERAEQLFDVAARIWPGPDVA